ncbi:hypothetical protein [uncultured Flavobacterium sp.]|uniref:DUF7000 family protein n=1 Tax=uncultured Flavobacterium sp. TaxID=165435 RepID=UPI0025D17007|nr:hypothetical protein [uncultured Flavobacterium sp.]
MDYRQGINYLKDLRNYFRKEYDSDFTVGSLYQGSLDCSWFSLKTEDLKHLKLKFVIVFNFELMQLEICFSGQNKDVRKKYWKIFKDSNWDKYHLADSIDGSLSIINHVIIENPDFSDTKKLTKQIEIESFKFMNEFQDILK